MKSIKSYTALFIITVAATVCLSGCVMTGIIPEQTIDVEDEETTAPVTTPTDTSSPDRTTTMPSDTTAAPSDTTTAPSVTTTEPFVTTTAPVETTEPPELDPETPHEHIEKAGASVAPSWDSVGHDGGVICERCHDTLSSPKVLPALKEMNSRYGYESLAAFDNGDALQTLYRELEDIALEFHDNSSADATPHTVIYNEKEETSYIIETGVCFAALGLTLDEANSVWTCFRADNPLYYWVSQLFVYSEDDIYLVCDKEFASGEVRCETNLAIYEKVFDMLSDESSSYMAAFSYHDSIISDMEYAYCIDGTTPETADIYHSVAGFVLENRGVCETYAKMFQLLLNYSGVENIIVNGTTDTGGHAWNLAKMDDGEWYWFDLTWDDTPDWKWGVSYSFFCVNDSENTRWRESYAVTSSEGFVDNHTPTEPGVHGINYMWSLPARSDSEFEYDGISHFESDFALDGVTYTVVGYRRVEVSAVESTGEVRLSGTVSYDGEMYEVVAIGKRTEGDYHQIDYTTSISQAAISTVEIGEGVTRIWDCAFSQSTDLTAVILPESLELIGAEAFKGCTALKTVYYNGSYEMWQKIEKLTNWKNRYTTITLICNDGEYTVR